MIRTSSLIATLILAVNFCWGQDRLLIIQGAAGEESYGERFSKAAAVWTELAKKSNIPFVHAHPNDESQPTKIRIQEWITSEEARSAGEIWIVYLGHGTSNATEAKLNLAGPDLSSEELAEWLAPYEGQLVFVHGGSASAPFITELAAQNRIVITATRSGAEVNYARFGEQFAYAIESSQSDLDLDGEVSLLEAFIAATNAVDTFYAESGRLTSEHALIDDDGDGRGHQASSFEGLRPKADVKDGRLARRTTFRTDTESHPLSPTQISERNRLEAELEELYSRKKDVPEEEYFAELETILDQLAALYRDPLDS